MNRPLSVPLPMALLLAGLAPIGVWLAPQDTPPREAGKIAVVDLKRLFESDAALKEDMTRINARKDEIEKSVLPKMREAYNALKLECESIGDQSSEKYVNAMTAALAKQEEIKQYKGAIEVFLNQEAARRNLAALGRYREKIAEYAAKRGLDVVLKVREPEDDDRLEARMQAAELGLVLYHAAPLDITEDVIKLLKTTK